MALNDDHQQTHKLLNSLSQFQIRRLIDVSNSASLCITQQAQTHVAFDDIIRICGDVTGEAEIADLCHSSFRQ